MTVSWHNDDLKISHQDSTMVDDFLKWITATYGTIGEEKSTHEKVHEYLGMKLNYFVKG